MARPLKRRMVSNMPETCFFGPKGIKEAREIIQMTVDEYEAIRLIDLDNLTQEECAKQMDVARTTVQAIYRNAREKIAKTLVNGCNLVIEGGDYQLCHGNHKRNCYKNYNGSKSSCGGNGHCGGRNRENQATENQATEN